MAEDIKNLVELFQKSCDKYADRELFGTKTGGSWTWMTYREFRKQVDDFRGGLANLGVKAGDKVGIVANNRVEWAVVATPPTGSRRVRADVRGAARRGVGVHPRRLRREGRGRVDRGDLREAARNSSASVKSLEHVIGLEAPLSDDHSYKALLERGAKHPNGCRGAQRPKEIAGFIYTSGTTGKPKGVILTHGNICFASTRVHEPVRLRARTTARCRSCPGRTPSARSASSTR